uniref:Uncharacterized protein n=1 Tax=Caenorhabditis japonica TaxID=281687 RepID=A0A8R1IMG4_CAEJA
MRQPPICVVFEAVPFPLSLFLERDHDSSSSPSSSSLATITNATVETQRMQKGAFAFSSARLALRHPDTDYIKQCSSFVKLKDQKLSSPT